MDYATAGKLCVVHPCTYAGQESESCINKIRKIYENLLNISVYPVVTPRPEVAQQRIDSGPEDAIDVVRDSLESLSSKITLFDLTEYRTLEGKLVGPPPLRGSFFLENGTLRDTREKNPEIGSKNLSDLTLHYSSESKYKINLFGAKN